jgi:hypothetical protein
MTEQDYLWLLCRIYQVWRLNYITSGMRSVYDDLRTTLSDAIGKDVENVVDSDLTDLFRPRASKPVYSPPVAPGPDESSESKPSKGKGKVN